MASSVFTAVIDEMTGATSSTPGLAGLVPAPAAGDEDKVLRGDGTWAEVEASGGTLRVVPFSIGVSSWTLVNGIYTSEFTTEFVTASSVEFVEYTDSFRNVIRGDLSWTKTSGGGGVTFRTDVVPSGTLVGEIRTIDRNDNKVAIITEQTAWPTMREVPFTIYVSDWAVNGNGKYEAVFESPFITETSHDFVEFDESIENATDGIKVIKAERTGATVGMKFISRRVPAGNISGTITPLDNADGKVVVALQDTVMPIENGGTGANTLKGAQDALGITALNASFATLSCTTPSTDGGETTVNYPTGFNYGNCVIIAAMYQRDIYGSAWENIVLNDSSRVDVELGISNIKLITRESDAQGRPLKIVLMKA